MEIDEAKGLFIENLDIGKFCPPTVILDGERQLANLSASVH